MICKYCQLDIDINVKIGFNRNQNASTFQLNKFFISQRKLTKLVYVVVITMVSDSP